MQRELSRRQTGPRLLHEEDRSYIASWSILWFVRRRGRGHVVPDRLFLRAPLAFDVRLCDSPRRPDWLPDADLAIVRRSN